MATSRLLSSPVSSCSRRELIGTRSFLVSAPQRLECSKLGSKFLRTLYGTVDRVIDRVMLCGAVRVGVWRE
jgi:hypothetical protein